MPEFWIPKREILRRRIKQEEEEIEQRNPPPPPEPPWTPQTVWEDYKRRIGILPPSEAAEMPREMMGKPFASLVTRPWWEKEAEPSELAQPPWIPQVAPYERWQAPPGVKGTLETMGEAPLYLAFPQTILDVALGKGLQAGMGALAKGGKGTARLVTQEAPKAVGAVKKEVDPVIKELFDWLKIERMAIKGTKQLRHAALGEKAAAIKEARGLSDVGKAVIIGKSARKGILPTQGITKPSPWNEEKVNYLRGLLQKSPQLKEFEWLRADDALSALLTDPTLALQPNEVRLLRRVFGEEFKEIIEMVQANPKWYIKIADVLNIPRALQASYDLSNPFRQSVVLMFRYPIKGFKNFKPMVKAFAGEKNARYADDMIRNHPDYDDLAHLMKVEFTEFGQVALKVKEEPFMTTLAERIPLIGRGIAASNRAFTTFANKMRFDVGLRNLNVLRRVDKALIAEGKAGLTEDYYKSMGQLINWASGRGPGFKAEAPILNALFWSPRLVLGRIALPTKLFSRYPEVRKEAWRMFAAFMGGMTAILGTAKMTGVADVELNTNSSDFGKLRIGNTRLDIWGGYAQYIRFLSQLTTGERKIVETGKLTDINRKDVLFRFAQSKTAPLPGLLLDILEGRTYVGEELTLESKNLLEQAQNRLVPLAWLDIIDAVKTDGAIGGGIGTLGMVGFGVSSYEPKKSQRPGFGSGLGRKQSKFGSGLRR